MPLEKRQNHNLTVGEDGSVRTEHKTTVRAFCLFARRALTHMTKQKQKQKEKIAKAKTTTKTKGKNKAVEVEVEKTQEMDVDTADKNPEEMGPDTGTKVKPDNKTFMGFDIAVLRDKIRKATMGYMRIDLISPPPGAIWGTFNDRKILESMVLPLLQNYGDTWVDNCCEARAIEVAVKPSWLVLDPRDPEKVPTAVNGKHVDDVPILEFTPEGARETLDDNLWMLGGNHRREALRRHLDGIAKRVEEMKAAVQKLQDDQHKGGLPCTGAYSGFDFEKDQEGDKLVEAIEVLEKKMATDRKWIVRLIDRGAPREFSLIEWGGS